MPREIVVPITLTVAGGSGTQDFTAWGTCREIIVEPPGGNGDYYWEIIDSNGVTRANHDKKLKGKSVACIVNHFQDDTYTFRIYDTKNNGSWSARIVLTE